MKPIWIAALTLVSLAWLPGCVSKSSLAVMIAGPSHVRQGTRENVLIKISADPEVDPQFQGKVTVRVVPIGDVTVEPDNWEADIGAGGSAERMVTLQVSDRAPLSQVALRVTATPAEGKPAIKEQNYRVEKNAGWQEPRRPFRPRRPDR
jgi:hypothetical protein